MTELVGATGKVPGLFSRVQVEGGGESRIALLQPVWSFLGMAGNRGMLEVLQRTASGDPYNGRSRRGNGPRRTQAYNGRLSGGGVFFRFTTSTPHFSLPAIHS